MSFSLDIPRDSLDDESDIVSSGREVTEQDRDLLRIDDEVVKALGSSSSSRIIPNMKGLLPKKKMLQFVTPNKRPKPGGDYAALGGGSNSSYKDDDFDISDDDEEGLIEGGSSSNSSYKPVSSKNKSKKSRSFFGRAHKLDTFRSEGDLSTADSDFSDSDFGDIEIDVETQPGKRKKRRIRNSHTSGKTQFLIFLLILLGFGFLYSIHDNDDNKNHRYKKISKSLTSNGTHQFYPTTIVISLDGFHPHYISEELTPNLNDLFIEKSGVPYMIPSFPSSTFPNHWTLVTGLYPSNHGIVGNTFFDSKTNKEFFNTKPGQSLQLEWWGGEPIWKTAKLQGVLSAVHMWPGSEVNWKVKDEDFNPMFVDKFNGSEPLSNKRDRVFQWIDQANYEQRPELILTYVPNVDTVGHQVGISGPEIRKTLQEVDSFVGTILDGIHKRKLEDIVNVIILSDHGMAPTSNERLVFLEDLMDIDTIDHLDGWPLTGIRLKDPNSGSGSLDNPKTMEETIQATYTTLKEKEDSSKFKVYLKENFPKEWNFGGVKDSPYSSRIAPVWLVPQVGWSITTRKQLQDMGGTYQPFGVHGYNNTESLMRALFLGTGPYFSDNKMYQPIPNVDVYNIVCDTLNLVPAKTDGAPVRRALEPLASKWIDPQPYPGVTFHTEILKVNSTYDILFGGNGGNMDDYRLNSTIGSGGDEDDTKRPTITDKLSDWWNSITGVTSDAFSEAKDWVSSKLGGGN